MVLVVRKTCGCRIPVPLNGIHPSLKALLSSTILPKSGSLFARWLIDLMTELD